jgi:acyl-[acyl carrier protein]--UDP-N-acetylglucosamine O-acyltransferase
MPVVIGEPPEHRDWQQGDPCFFPEIDPTAKIGCFTTVDAGMQNPTRVGPRTWLMKHVHVGHDAQIGADCELAPGTVVGGHCAIGDGVRIGVNACLRPFVTVGAGARIGAGAVVVTDVPPGEVWVGNPARRLREAVGDWPDPGDVISEPVGR